VIRTANSTIVEGEHEQQAPWGRIFENPDKREGKRLTKEKKKTPNSRHLIETSGHQRSRQG